MKLNGNGHRNGVTAAACAAAAIALVIPGTCAFAPAPAEASAPAPAVPSNTMWGLCGDTAPAAAATPATPDNASFGMGVTITQSTDTYSRVGDVIDYTVELNRGSATWGCFVDGSAEDALGNTYDNGKDVWGETLRFAPRRHVVTQADIDAGHVDNYANGHSTAAWVWYPAHAQTGVVTAHYVAPEGE